MMPNEVQQNLKELLVEFGLAVKNRRIQLGYSQEELAYRAGLHRTYVTDIERGSRNVSIDSIAKLAKALNVSLTEMFSLIESKKQVSL